jgi:hypothetical protein
MKTYTIKMVWDEGYWHSEIDDDAGFGLTLNSGSFDALVERVRIALPDMLEECFNYTGPVEIVFEVERKDTLRGLGDGGLRAQSEKVAV